MNEAKELLKIARMLIGDGTESLPPGFVKEMERLDFDYATYNEEFVWESGYGYDDSEDESEQDSISSQFHKEIKPLISKVERLGKEYGLKLYFNTSAEYGLVTVEARPMTPSNFKVESIGIYPRRDGATLQLDMKDKVEHIDDFQEWLEQNWKKIRSRTKVWKPRGVETPIEKFSDFLKSIDYRDMYMDYRSFRGRTVEVEVRKRFEG